jgi:hypothetical protein
MRIKAQPELERYAPTVTAAVLPYTPPNYGSIGIPFDQNGAIYVSRESAMSVPAVARARNILCGTLGTIPLNEYNSQDQEQRRTAFGIANLGIWQRSRCFAYRSSGLDHRKRWIDV